MTPEQLEYVTAIAEKYEYGHGRWNKAHAERVATITQKILQQLANLNVVTSKDADLLLARAIALPHDIGRNPKSEGFNEGKEHNLCSFETLKKELKSGPLNQDESVIIQYCSLFHTGDEWRHTTIPRKPELTKRLAAILRIADSLDYGLSQKVKDIIVSLQGEEVVCKVVASASLALEINRARQKSDFFKVVYGKNIEFA